MQTPKKTVLLILLSIVFLLSVSCSDHSPTEPEGLIVSGRIVDSNGGGIRNVTVRVTGDTFTCQKETDYTGNYTINGFADGIFHLTFEKAGYTFDPDSVNVTVEGLDVTVEDIIATVYGSVLGRVTDVDGNGVSGVTITLTFNGTICKTITDSQGVYFFTDLDPGTYHLTLEGGDWLFSRSSYLVETGDAHIEKNFTAYKIACRDVNIANFLGYEIPRTNNLKRYSLTNISAIADMFRGTSMSWFAPGGVSWTKLGPDMVLLDPYPVGVCHTAYGFYAYYSLHGTASYKTAFLNNVNWLLENHDENYYLANLEGSNHYPGFVELDGWTSAMSQGEALSVTSMAYNMTGEKKYLEGAEGFFSTLYRNTGQKWCFGVDSEGYYWPEEYPNKDFCHVLNGMVFALWGLWDYYVITKDEFALALFEAGVKSLVDHYPMYRVKGPYCTRYCLHYKSSIGENYHTIHTMQFQTFAEFFNIPEFWDAYDMCVGE